MFQENTFVFQCDDPLWDGLNCNPESNCCDFNRPPYFVNDLGKTLTVDSVDARLCFIQGALTDDVLSKELRSMLYLSRKNQSNRELLM